MAFKGPLTEHRLFVLQWRINGMECKLSAIYESTIEKIKIKNGNEKVLKHVPVLLPTGKIWMTGKNKGIYSRATVPGT